MTTIYTFKPNECAVCFIWNMMSDTLNHSTIKFDSLRIYLGALFHFKNKIDLYAYDIKHKET